MLSHHENNVNILTTKYLALIIFKIIDKMDDSVAYQAKNKLFVEKLQPPVRAAQTADKVHSEGSELCFFSVQKPGKMV